MSPLSDRGLDRLRALVDEPDLSGTRYQLVGREAEGGMASVWRARDTVLAREVALKVLPPEAGGSELAARLAEEARILAQLEHPGIVPVHDAGTLPDGRVFYAMKLVRGRRLDFHARESASLPALLRVFERICETVAFAHGQGVLHRDLKPENVMIGAFGEVLVLDWGIAKRVGEPAGPPAAAGPARPGTAHGAIVGTPAYMAPEQARGEPVDARADVYGLGAVLHVLLHGAPPPSEGAALPRRRLPRPLDAVLRKALAPAAAERYAGARELADEIGRFLDGAAVRALPEGPLDAAARLLRTQRLLVALVATYVIVRVLLLLLR
ncbi:MAG: serine/threonine-protein kinase [Vicinamibacteria bacterium]